MMNFIMNYLYYGIVIIATVVVTALLTCLVVLAIKVVKNFLEDLNCWR